MIIPPIVFLALLQLYLVFQSRHNILGLPMILVSIITQYGLLSLSSFLSLATFIIISWRPSATSWLVLCLLVAIQLSHYHLYGSQHQAEDCRVSRVHHVGALSLVNPRDNVCQSDEHRSCVRDLWVSSHLQARRSLSLGLLRLLGKPSFRKLTFTRLPPQIL